MSYNYIYTYRQYIFNYVVYKKTGTHGCYVQKDTLIYSINTFTNLAVVSNEVK